MRLDEKVREDLKRLNRNQNREIDKEKGRPVRDSYEFERSLNNKNH